MYVCVCGLCMWLHVGPVREPELDQLVEQLKNMGFDEVSSSYTTSLSVSLSLSLCLSICLFVCLSLSACL